MLFGLHVWISLVRWKQIRTILLYFTTSLLFTLIHLYLSLLIETKWEALQHEGVVTFRLLYISFIMYLWISLVRWKPFKRILCWISESLLFD